MIMIMLMTNQTIGKTITIKTITIKTIKTIKIIFYFRLHLIFDLFSNFLLILRCKIPRRLVGAQSYSNLPPKKQKLKRQKHI